MGTDTDEINTTVGKAPDVQMPRRSRKRPHSGWVREMGTEDWERLEKGGLPEGGSF